MSTQAAAQKHKIAGWFTYTLTGGFQGRSKNLDRVLGKETLFSINGIEV